MVQMENRPKAQPLKPRHRLIGDPMLQQAERFQTNAVSSESPKRRPDDSGNIGTGHNIRHIETRSEASSNHLNFQPFSSKLSVRDLKSVFRSSPVLVTLQRLS
jgi:hypothetical protein